MDEQHTLPFGSAEDVRQEVLTRLQTIGKDGGLILGPTHHVQLDTPMENFWAMVETIRRFVPHVDTFFGIERTAEERDARVRAFMSLFVGYFMTSMFFEAPTDDDAIVDAMLAIMGWEQPAQT